MDEAADVEMAITDMADDWQHAQDAINNKVLEKAVEEGVTKVLAFDF